MKTRLLPVAAALLVARLLIPVLCAAEPAEVLVDCGKSLGPIKPLHGINNSKLTHGELLPELRDAGIPYCRLHDAGGRYGGTYYVDIPNLFPDFAADPDNPASYEFAFTDAYFKGLTRSGVKIFYRLGVTIENFHRIKAYRIHPPKDYGKFAKICERIVRHYNEGWADGFHYGIKYWEIWNEPENPPMWTGTRQQYFELYRVVSNHLKACFPELKVGGYAGCGFYAINRPKTDDFRRSFLVWFDEFLTYVTAPGTAAPLDFFSWHLYTADPAEIVLHANYVDQKLKAAGLARTENIFDEWNYLTGRPDQFDEMKEMPGAAFVAAAFCLMQNSPIAKAMYYDAFPQRTYCGLYYFPSGKVTKTYYSFKAFNELYQLGTQVETSVGAEDAKSIYALAARGQGGRAAVLVVNRADEPREILLRTKGLENAAAKVRLLDQDHQLEPAAISQDGKLTLPALAVALVQY